MASIVMSSMGSSLSSIPANMDLRTVVENWETWRIGVGEREGGRKRGREGGREGGRKGGREGEREGGREGRREKGREGRREGEREREI